MMNMNKVNWAGDMTELSELSHSDLKWIIERMADKGVHSESGKSRDAVLCSHSLLVEIADEVLTEYARRTGIEGEEM
jgi:hypothetical protein